MPVDRWATGYAYGLNSLYDRPQRPPVNEIARHRVGRLAMAGSDAAGMPTRRGNRPGAPRRRRADYV